MDESLEKEHQRKYTYHFFFAHGIFEELKDVEDFINSTEKFLTNNLQVNGTLLNKEENINPRFHHEVQFGSIFPDILWRTTFLHSYFLLESSLYHICKNLKEAEGYKLALSDIAGNGIFRASIYLKKVCNINEPFTDNAWARLMDYNKIRNIFVHSDGLISKKTGVELAKRNEGLFIAIIELDKVAIRFSREFTLKALQTIEHFFQTLQQSMLN